MQDLLLKEPEGIANIREWTLLKETEKNETVVDQTYKKEPELNTRQKRVFLLLLRSRKESNSSDKTFIKTSRGKQKRQSEVFQLGEPEGTYLRHY